MIKGIKDIRQLEVTLTVRKGWFVICKTRFSVSVWAISSLATITSFLRIFMAMISPVSLSLHMTTYAQLLIRQAADSSVETSMVM